KLSKNRYITDRLCLTMLTQFSGNENEGDDLLCFLKIASNNLTKPVFRKYSEFVITCHSPSYPLGDVNSRLYHTALAYWHFFNQNYVESCKQYLAAMNWTDAMSV